MLPPGVTHVPCDLDRQQRLARAARERAGRGLRPSGRRGLRREPGPGHDLRPRGEDVWRALRW